jgi:YD repeat-containing protein
VSGKTQQTKIAYAYAYDADDRLTGITQGANQVTIGHNADAWWATDAAIDSCPE